MDLYQGMIIIIAEFLDGKLCFVFSHGLNFFIKLPMANQHLKGFPGCDNAYGEDGLKRISICIIMLMHIDSVIYLCTKIKTRQPLKPLHFKQKWMLAIENLP